jgi:hypothetical protein
MPVDLIGLGKLEYDLDLNMPIAPKVQNNSLEVYINGGLYVLNENGYANFPKSKLQFINDESLAFQVAISEFIANQFI